MCYHWKIFSMVCGAQQLQSLTIKPCGVTDVFALCSFSYLVHLSVPYNCLLRSLSGLAGVPSLEKVHSSRCNLQNLDDLSSSP